MAVGSRGAGASTEVRSYVRLSVNISREVADALKTLVDRHGSSLTEEVRRAISMWKYLDDARRAGAQILRRDPDGAVRELVIQ